MKWSLLLTLVSVLYTTAAISNPVAQCKPKDLLDDAELDLTQYKGKFVYLDFWASWCEPCRASFPFMNELTTKYPSDQLTVIGISLDDNVKDANKFLAKIPAEFPVMIDRTGKCAEFFGVKGMPSSYIIDKNGKVVYSHSGFRKSDQQKLTKVIAETLGELKP